MPELDEYTIDVNLDEVDDGTEPVPTGPATCLVNTISEKKFAANGGQYPYYEYQLKPNDHPGKTLWLKVSTHPKALWHLKLWAKATGLNQQKPNMKEAVGKYVTVNVTQVPSTKDPERKVNEVNPPYMAVR